MGGQQVTQDQKKIKGWDKMKRFIKIATMVSLTLFFCSNLVWAGILDNIIASSPEPEIKFLFGIGLLGLATIGRFKVKN
jgi:hypothetical protein